MHFIRYLRCVTVTFLYTSSLAINLEKKNHWSYGGGPALLSIYVIQYREYCALAHC